MVKTAGIARSGLRIFTSHRPIIYCRSTELTQKFISVKRIHGIDSLHWDGCGSVICLISNGHFKVSYCTSHSPCDRPFLDPTKNSPKGGNDTLKVGRDDYYLVCRLFDSYGHYKL